MSRPVARLTFAILVVVSLQAALGAQAQEKRPLTPAPLPCGDLVGFQVLLDRQGFSPGQIDGLPGANFSHALAAMLSARGLPLATLGYGSVEEALAERFHTSPALLRRLNRGGAILEGRTLRVPAVTPFDQNITPPFDPAGAGVTILVSREDSALRVLRADGSIVFYAPVTTGSVHDRLPIGHYKVRGMRWRPAFHYNPALFWDAREGDEKATIKPGPNNPVGVVWIALSLENYGLHGTPEPGRVGHGESHGCVRMTNWDAARVAALVKPGTPVEFDEQVHATAGAGAAGPASCGGTQGAGTSSANACMVSSAGQPATLRRSCGN